jgi:hypothetical protein
MIRSFVICSPNSGARHYEVHIVAQLHVESSCLLFIITSLVSTEITLAIISIPTKPTFQRHGASTCRKSLESAQARYPEA